MFRKLNHILHKDILGVLFINSQITHVRNIQRTNHFRIISCVGAHALTSPINAEIFL